MARQIPPLSAVRVFEAAARHLNFTRAAEELAMTQAAVSYQVRMIEDRLGTSLFVRSGRRVSLSPAGQRLAPQISTAFDMLDEAFGKVREVESGVLTISAAPGIAASWLGPRLAKFQMTRPDIAIRLLATGDLADFGHDGVDVAIRIGQGDWPGLRAVKMFPADFTPMCSPAYLERVGPFDEPSQLLEVLRLNSDDVWWRAWFDQVGVTVREDFARYSLHVDSQVIEGMAAIAGDGLAMLTPRFWRFELATGRLVRLFPHVGSGSDFWLVCPEHRFNSAKVKAFREWLMAEVAADE
ncbi:transcriptional regulator GcvA [Sphingomonas sp. SRS2]|uniref:transcriptional regulator GcvA n=1 Tax=Sphingomonas sp. SRS2 TaxID=133190 RepID=UPI00061844B0|nr:transcriptional regulator GcvA [Sphingomonas sp. SRS2]KKC26414.1 LysR family transcriptional regulator [Sphingomonas sp. SRS2]